MTDPPLRLVVLISGRGSNLQSIIDAIAAGTLAAQICAVVSSRSGAAGIERAKRAGIETRVVDHRAYAERQEFDRALHQVVDAFTPQLVVNAGFMRILTATFVDHYKGRMVNIHPSLLPCFPGLNTHRRALEAGIQEHGVTVHFVTAELDGGPIIAQARVPVREGDDEATLAARVLEQEHRLYPEVIGWFAQGRLELDGEDVRLDGRTIEIGLIAPG